MKAYTIIKTHRGRTTETTGTLPELVEHFGYTLKAGASYNGQKGCKKVNENPKTIKSLMTALQNAVYNTQGSRYDQDSYDYTEATTDTTATTTTTENKEETTMTNTTTTKKATTNNGWERIAKRNLKNAYNWNVGGMYNDFQDGNITEEVFNNWIQNTALDMIYLEGITTLYTGDSCGGDAPKEMRFAGKDFCYKYLISLFKKDGYTVTAHEAEPKKATKKTTKVSKKATTPTTVTVVLKAFTGMKIAIYTGTLNDSTITITTKAGKTMEFNLDGTQKVDTKAGARFNNKIEIITEA